MTGDERASPYAWYVLALLVAVYCLNFVDRQIISILAEDIKRDLGLADEDLGFLYGTAFGVFYALFGIPLGRLADMWNRTRLLTIGLGLWSGMTALSGLASNGAQLTAARIGVGIGEATAGPAAFSMLSDRFPPRLRATALAIYSAGLYIGVGVSLGIGGWIVKRWNDAYPDGGPLALAGWQVAYLAVGLIGLPLALWIATLREPVRGASEGLASAEQAAPFRGFLKELSAIIPPFTLLTAARRGPRVLAQNLGVALGIAAGVAGLHVAGEPLTQWTSVGIGVYALISWASELRRLDAPAHALIVANPAMWATIAAYGLNACIAYTTSFWAAPYAMRELGADPANAGLWIGGTLAVAGFLGATLGGIVADRLHRANPAGRLIMVIVGAVGPAPFVAVAFTATSLPLFLACLFCAGSLASSALGAAAATTQDLVLPRMRGTATAAFFIGTTMLGLALGPYVAGRVSTLSGSLSTGVLAILAVAPIAAICALLAYRWVPAANAEKLEQAGRHGEMLR